MSSCLYATDQKILQYHSKKSKEGKEWKQQNNDNKTYVIKPNSGMCSFGLLGTYGKGKVKKASKYLLKETLSNT